MSHNLMDSLEEMASWNEETCHQNVDTYLPKLLTRFEESTFIQDGINILQLICKSFVPIVPTEELEDKIFSHICQMICSLLTGAVNKVHLNVNGALKDTAEELKETIAECLQWIAVIVESVERCVQQMLDVNGSLDLSSVRSLPVCAVTVLKHTYAHCKESTALYGKLLEDVGESLSGLFKKAHSLQTALLALLDKITASSCYEEHVQILCTVCSGLFEVCKVVNSLDIKLVVSLWKAISRICSQNLTLLRDRLEVCPIVSYLCQEISSGYAYLFQLCPASDPDSLSQGDDKAFSKWVKIVGFQMKVLVALLRDFSDYLGYCEKDVVCLLLSLHRSLPPCLGAGQISEAQESDIRSQIVSATLPILKHLIGNRAFRIHLTVVPEDIKSEDYLPLLLLQLMVLDLLPKCEGDVIDYWLRPANHNRENPSKPLVSVIFDSVRLCFLEMRVPVMMPGIMVAGKPQRPVSLYEHVVVRLCGFIGSCLGRHFAVLEQALLDNVLQCDGLSCLLATDAWCFMARYGSATLCDGHVQCLVQLYLKLTHKKKNKGRHEQPVHNVVELIRRLIKFLSPPQQISLAEQYPPQNNRDLWLTLTLAPFCEQVQRTVGMSLMERSLKVMSGSEMKLSLVLQAINSIHQVVSDQSVREACITPPQMTFVETSVCGLWASVATSTSGLGGSKEKFMVKLLDLTRHLVTDVMKETDVLQITEILHAHLNGENSSNFALSCCHFVNAAVQRLHKFSDDMQNKLVASLAQVNRLLLTHKDPLVQSTGLTGLASLATDRRHQTFLSLCFEEGNSLNARLNDFLNKVPFGEKEFNLQDFLRHQRSASTNGSNATSSKEEEDHMEEKEGDSSKDVGVGQSANFVDTDGNVIVLSSPMDADQKDPSDEGNCINPPAKKAKLSSALHEEDDGSELDEGSGHSSSQPDPWQVILDGLNKTAADLEQRCSSVPPPEWFTSAASLTLARINDCLTVSASWFDSLS